MKNQTNKHAIQICQAHLVSICKALDVDYKLIISKVRKKPIAQKRHECMKRIRVLGFSYPIMGQVFNRDHSTVMYGCGWRTKVK